MQKILISAFWAFSAMDIPIRSLSCQLLGVSFGSTCVFVFLMFFSTLTGNVLSLQFVKVRQAVQTAVAPTEIHTRML